MGAVDFASIFSPSAAPASVPAASPAVSPAAAPAPVRAVEPSRAAGDPAAAKPAPAQAVPAPLAVKTGKPPKPVPGLIRSQGVSSVMMMDLATSPFEAAPVLEHAALLFAAGRDFDARDALQAALQQGGMPPAAAREAWMLLFDLFENLGQRDQFDAAAIDFAVAFETSPPAFHDRSDIKDPMLETGGGQYVALPAVLDHTAAPGFARLASMAGRSQTLRIEFGKITSITAEGCQLLFDHLRGFKKSGHDLVFSSAGHLIGLLTGAIETGRRDPAVLWLLLLEMYQFQYMHEAFEETALNYCVTYEVSPPSWEEPARLTVNTRPPGQAPIGLQVPQDAFYVKGVLQGSITALLKDLGAYGAGKPLVVIDLFDVRRIDAAAAGEFINLVTSLYVQGKEIEIRSPSPLIATLFVSLGFAEQARFTQRGA